MPRDDPFGWVGHVLDGKYRIESVVGEGGFGVVYRATHMGFEQAVAVKCLKLKKGLDPEVHDEFLRKFIAEGRLLHQLSRATADVVQALDVGVATSPKGIETPFLVLEWLDGTTLDRELRARRGKKATIDEALDLLEPAARGLAVAHEQGVSHRDVKPGNIMLTGVGSRLTLKVVDFGIAKMPDDATTEVGPFDNIGSGMQAFTPRYGAPEQFSRKYGATGPWTDVYALALLFVEVVTGAPALDGDDPVQLYVETSDVQRRPTLRTRGAEVSDAVEAVLAHALTVDPRQRYRDAGEFWDALRTAAAEGGDRPRIKSVRPPAISRPEKPAFDREATDTDRATASGPQTGPHTSTGTGTITVLLREQRKRKVVWIGAIVATALVVTIGFFGMRKAEKVEDAAYHGAASASGSVVAPPPSVASAAPRPSVPPAPVVDASLAVTVPPGMVLVPGGTFTMGSDGDSKSERPAHPVTLTHSFFIDKTEVTAAEYGACMKSRACTHTRMITADAKGRTHATNSPTCNRPYDRNYARQPINCVTYAQAAAYCKHVGKRLPTEAEWEYAARGTDGREYPWGNAPAKTCRQAISGGAEGACGGRKGTFEVGTTVDGVSPFGLFDTSGNVWEWVVDDYAAFSPGAVTDPLLPPRGAKGVIRGGSWDYSGAADRVTARMGLDRDFALNNVGFRCAK